MSFSVCSARLRPPHPLSLHDALPISAALGAALAIASSQPILAKKAQRTYVVMNEAVGVPVFPHDIGALRLRSEEQPSELQSPCNIVCRLLLEKKKKRSRSEQTVVTNV